MSGVGPLIAVFADESCLGNGKPGDNPGGAGILLERRLPAGEIVRRDLWVSERSTTNNRMALRSAIETFRALSAKGKRCRVVFTSDSRYLVDGMTSWVHGWARRGWKRAGGEIENLELWHEAVSEAHAHEIDWRWVRGHAGHPQNEYANHLATSAAAQQTESGGVIDSGFEGWMASVAGKKTATATLAPFPGAEQFRAGATLPPVPIARL